MRIPNRRMRVLFLSVLATLILYGPVPAHAATQYSLTLSPNRVQEQNSPGVTVTLSVGGASTGQLYAFLFTVVDPLGSKSNATRSASAPAPSFSFTLTYPSDFKGGDISYIGQYSVNVAQGAPTASVSVASGRFTVGLTDKVSYERTFSISIKADAYKPNETLTVIITHSAILAPNFPTLINADPMGNLVFNWLTTPELPLGVYNVTISGNTTAKPILDSQTFTLNPTSVTIDQIEAPTSIMRTQTARFNFSASYLGSGTVQSGTGTLQIEQPDGTIKTTPGTYDATSGSFTATYRIPLTSLEGDWTVSVKKNSLDDGYGNGGPDISPSTAFAVLPASLNVNLTFTNGNITAGNAVAIYSTILAPDGSLFTSGAVSGFVSPSGRTPGNEVNLLFDSSQGKWVGSYTVQSSDPSGIWVVQVLAADPYGNSGSASTSSLVTVVSLSQDSTPTMWFLTLFATIGGGLTLGIFAFRRRRRFKHRLHFDLQAIGQEATKVKNQEFFKSLKEQLKKQKGTGGS